MPLDAITMTEGSFITHEPDEWFAGDLIRIEDGEDYGFGETIRFVIALDGEESETWALASQKMSPKSKLYGWVKGIDPNLIPDIGEALQYKKLADRRVEVMFDAESGRVTKIRSEKKAVQSTGLQKKQAAAAKAKIVDPDTEPF